MSQGKLQQLRDPNLEYKSRKVCERMSDCLVNAANEPSLAFYRVQEHVHKTLPVIIKKRIEIEAANKKVSDGQYGLDLAIEAAADLTKAEPHFTACCDRIKDAMFYHQQLVERSQAVTASSFNPFH